MQFFWNYKLIVDRKHWKVERPLPIVCKMVHHISLMPHDDPST